MHPAAPQGASTRPQFQVASQGVHRNPLDCVEMPDPATAFTNRVGLQTQMPTTAPWYLADTPLVQRPHLSSDSPCALHPHEIWPTLSSVLVPAAPCPALTILTPPDDDDGLQTPGTALGVVSGLGTPDVATAATTVGTACSASGPVRGPSFSLSLGTTCRRSVIPPVRCVLGPLNAAPCSTPAVHAAPNPTLPTLMSGQTICAHATPWNLTVDTTLSGMSPHCASCVCAAATTMHAACYASESSQRRPLTGTFWLTPCGRTLLWACRCVNLNASVLSSAWPLLRGLEQCHLRSSWWSPGGTTHRAGVTPQCAFDATLGFPGEGPPKTCLPRSGREEWDDAALEFALRKSRDEADASEAQEQALAQPLRAILLALGVHRRAIPRDGDCQFRAVSLLAEVGTASELRQFAATTLQKAALTPEDLAFARDLARPGVLGDDRSLKALASLVGPLMVATPWGVLRATDARVHQAETTRAHVHDKWLIFDGILHYDVGQVGTSDGTSCSATFSAPASGSGEVAAALGLSREQGGMTGWLLPGTPVTADSGPNQACLSPNKCPPSPHAQPRQSGTVRLGSFNVGSLTDTRMLDILDSTDLDVYCFQEVRLSTSAQRLKSAMLRKSNFHAVWGPPQDTDATPHGGVAIVSRHKMVRLPIRNPMLQVSGRCALAWLPLQGRRGLIIACLYGISGASSHRGLEEQNRRLIEATLEEISTHGTQAAFLCADLNQHPSTVEPLATAMGVGRWVSLNGATGQAFVPTYALRSGDWQNRVSCIDSILANKHAAAMVRSLTLECRVGSQHKLLTATIEAHLLTETLQLFPRPSRLLLAVADNLPEEVRVKCCDAAWAPFRTQFGIALETGDVTEAYYVWSRGAERYLQDTCLTPEESSRTRGGRGKIPDPITRPATAAVTAAWLDAGATDHTACKLDRLLRRVREANMQLARQPGLGSQLSWQKLQAKLVADCEPVGVAVALDLADKDNPLHSAVGELQKKLKNHTRAVQQRRLAEWRKAMQANCKVRFSWLGRHTYTPSGRCLKDPCSTELLAGHSTQLRALKTAWQPIFQKYLHTEPPQVSGFLDEYAFELGVMRQKSACCHIPDLTAARLADGLKRCHPSACGLDGWKPEELKCLPNALLSPLACVLARCEADGTIPESWCYALTSLVPKGAGDHDGTSSCPSPEGATDQRPITVLSAPYRLWSSVRYRDVDPWARGWAPECLTANCEQAVWRMTLDLSSCQAEDMGQGGVLLDRTKFFDLQIRDIGFAIMTTIGLHPAILGILRTLYGKLQLALKYNDSTGPWFCATNGWLQGDSMSLLMVLGLQTVLAIRLQHRVPRLLSVTFVDDSTFWSTSLDVWKPLQDELATFDAASGNVCNMEKTKAFATNAGHRQTLAAFCVQGRSLAMVTVAKVLGVSLEVLTAEDTAVRDERTKSAIVRAQRARHLPLPPVVRAEMLAACAVAPYVFGTSHSDVDAVMRTRLTEAVTLALAGSSSRQWRELHLFFTLIHQGHRLWPGPADTYAGLSALNRFVECHRDAALWRRAWENHRLHPQGWGVMCRLEKLLCQCGLSWEGPMVLKGIGGLIPLGGPSRKAFAHQLRHCLRRHAWTCISRRRKDLRDVRLWEAGIDYDAAVGMLRKGSALSPWCRGLLSNAMTGALHTQDRRHAAKLAATDQCACGSRDSSLHLFAECALTAPQREPALTLLPDDLAAQPMAFKCCGLLPADPVLESCKEALGLHDPEPAERPILLSGLEWTRAGRIVAATDGSCKHQQHTMLRRAGAGVYLGPGHVGNRSVPIMGSTLQSAQRGELKAALIAMQLIDGPLEILSDSELLCSGVRAVLEGCGKPPAEHSDLWSAIQQHLTLRGPTLLVTKVKGHATIAHVQEGKIEEREMRWNDEADKLAVHGSTLHPPDTQVPPANTKSAKWRIAVSKTWHRCMLNILQARAHKEALLAKEEPRGPPGGRKGRSEPADSDKGAPFEQQHPKFPWHEDREATEGTAMLDFGQLPASNAPCWKQWRSTLTKHLWYKVCPELYPTAIHAYASGLLWRHSEHHVSWLELALDFEASLGCPLSDDSREPLTWGEKATLTRALFAALALMCEKPAFPPARDKEVPQTRTLAHIGLDRQPGIRHWRPCFRQTLAVHAGLQRLSLMGDMKLQSTWGVSELSWPQSSGPAASPAVRACNLDLDLPRGSTSRRSDKPTMINRQNTLSRWLRPVPAQPMTSHDPPLPAAHQDGRLQV